MAPSLCINPKCQHINADCDLLCIKCQSELLIEGQYRAIKLLGNNSLYCDTYEIVDLDNNTYKILKLLKEYEPKLVELFNREFKVLQNLSYLGIPKAEAQFEFPIKNCSTPALCLVMEKIDGMNLEELIHQKGSPISETVALKWISQLTLIIQEIHNHDLYHRDIKPSNIMLQNDGRLALIDFGAVGLISSSNANPGRTVVYTQNYAAPEQLRGNSVPQSDFFSLGRTFVHLLTGQAIATIQATSSNAPLSTDSVQSLDWHQHASNLTPELIALLDDLMAERIENRPANTTEILQRLAAIDALSRSKRTAQIEPTQIIAPGSQTHSKNRSTSSPTALPKTEVIALVSETSHNTVQPKPINNNSMQSKRLGLVLLVAGLSLFGALAYGMWNILQPRPPVGATTAQSPANGQKPDPTGVVPVAQQCSSSQLVKQQGNNLFGVIEIGSSGVKGEVIQKLKAPNSAGHTLEPREENIESQDVTPIKAENKEKTVKAVNDMFLEMQKRFGIPCEHIVIYGSSGFSSKAPQVYQDNLVQEIKTMTGRDFKTISADQEAIYVFNAIVPNSRLDQVLMLDVGSGNTKGAFLNAQGAAQARGTLSFPWGMKSFTEEVKAKQGSQDFVTALTSVKGEKLPDFRQKVRMLPILESKSRVYLAGGIVWSLATLLHPCQTEQVIEKEDKTELPSHFVRLSNEDLTTFYNNVTRDQGNLFKPNLSQCTEEQRKRAKKDIAKIQNKEKGFSIEQLTAGAELLRMFSDSLNFTDKDAIFFSRYAFEALPIGYLKEQIGNI